MQIQTQYDTMTDEQLFIEMQHRYDTFGNSLGGYQEGGIQIFFWDEWLWLHYLEDDLPGMSIQLAFTFSPKTDKDIVTYHPDEKRFREILLLCLNAKFTLFNNHTFDGEYDQQQYLEEYKCTVCQENCSPLTPESLDPLPAPLPGHFHVVHHEDTRTPQEWAQDMFDLCLHFQVYEVQVQEIAAYIRSATRISKDEHSSINWIERAAALQAKLDTYVAEHTKGTTL